MTFAGHGPAFGADEMSPAGGFAAFHRFCGNGRLGRQRLTARVRALPSLRTLLAHALTLLRMELG
jgi:hypothetical protein